jgi:microcystin degradation protein MlrC
VRIAIGGIMHESNTFATTLTDRSRFVEGSLARGEAILPVWRNAHHEMGGFIEGARRFDFDLAPTVMAWATPAGPVADEVLDEVIDGIVADVRLKRADGLLLALHGAMVTPEHLAADEEVLWRLRDALGADLPIIASLDYHGNVTERMAELAHGLVGYQTYPHVDQRECGLKAAELMARTVRGDIGPVVAVAKPPMVINILGQETEREPMKSLMVQAREAERRPGVLSVSVMAGFPYADVPAMGPAVIAVADADRALVAGVADELGRSMWKIRDRLFVRCATPEEAVRDAMGSARKPVILVDLGDNIGGGSAGDGTVLLREIVRLGASGAVVVLYDPEAVAEAARIGPGGALRREVGGRVDRMHGDPVQVSGVVRSLHDGKWEETQARHGGRRFNDQGPTAVVDVDRGNTLVLNSLRTPPFSLGQLTSLDIDPSRQSILVVKAAIAYKAAYAPIAARVIEVDTPGLTAVDPARFEYRHRRKPMFPFEK